MHLQLGRTRSALADRCGRGLLALLDWRPSYGNLDGECNRWPLIALPLPVPFTNKLRKNFVTNQRKIIQ